MREQLLADPRSAAGAAGLRLARERARAIELHATDDGDEFRAAAAYGGSAESFAKPVRASPGGSAYDGCGQQNGARAVLGAGPVLTAAAGDHATERDREARHPGGARLHQGRPHHGGATARHWPDDALSQAEGVSAGTTGFQARFSRFGRCGMGRRRKSV